MLITFLPYTVSDSGTPHLLRTYHKLNKICPVLTFNPLWRQFSLMATFPENVLGILLFCGCVMVIGVIQVRRRLSVASSPPSWLLITRRLSPPVGDRGVRLQPPLPAERADPDLGEPDLLQTPHPQGHHAGSAHVLHRQRLLLHLLPARR